MVRAGQRPVLNARASSCHCVSRVIVAAESPASEPRKLLQCRPEIESGQAVQIQQRTLPRPRWQDRRGEPAPLPVASSMCLSLTPGCRTCTAPAAVVTSRAA